MFMKPPSSTPQLPFKIPQIPSNRDYKALNRATLGGLGYQDRMQEAFPMSRPVAFSPHPLGHAWAGTSICPRTSTAKRAFVAGKAPPSLGLPCECQRRRIINTNVLFRMTAAVPAAFLGSMLPPTSLQTSRRLVGAESPRSLTATRQNLRCFYRTLI